MGRRKNGPEPMPASPAAAAEGSEGYPKTYAVAGLRERRLLATLRLVGVCLFASLMIVIVQAFLLVSLFPLKEARPFLVQLADEGSVAASIEPLRESFDASELLTEKLVREYVVNRHEILRSTPVMQYRWGEFLEVTTDPAAYGRFIEQANGVLNDIRSEGAERRAEIISVSVLQDNVFIVDFRSISVDRRDREVGNQVFTATLTVEFRKLDNLTRAEMLINPTGFTVTDYTLAEKSQ